MTATVWGDDAPLVVELLDDGERVRIVVRGELDIETTDVFDDGVTKAVNRQRPLAIDLREATFVGSRGLAAIVRAHRHMGDGLGPLTVIVGRAIQRRTFEVTGLDGILLIDDRSADGS